MAGSLSDYAENKILDHIVGKTSFTMPDAFLALYTVAPSDSSAGTEVTTAGGTLYARVDLAGADFSAASGGAITNANTITFPTAGASWGTVVAAAITDSTTEGGGNVIIWGDLAVSKAVAADDTLSFPAGSIDFTLD
jgi:hypothetical protein